jgi:hypothetical protein
MVGPHLASGCGKLDGPPAPNPAVKPGRAMVKVSLGITLPAVAVIYE